jgi:trigger factor
LEHKVTEKENWTRQLEITVTREEIKPQLDKAYSDARPYISHKGFRKGQVPINFIKKLYGKQIEGDAFGDIANELFNRILQEQKLSFIGEPKLTKIDDKKDTVAFTFSYEVMPEFKLADYQDIEIDEPVHNVTDEEIEKELEEMSINNGNLAAAEQIVDDLHIAHVTITEIDEATGLKVKGSETQETDFFLHSPYVTPDLKELLLNLKEGDNFNYKPAQNDPTAPLKTFNIKIEKILKLTPVELTDEFIKEYTQSKFETLDEYREEVGFKLQEQWNQKSREAMEEQLVKKITNMNDFEVPKGLLWKVVEGMTEDLKKQYKDIPNFQNVTTADMFNDLEPSATYRLKWEILRAKIIEKEKLEVEDHDLDQMVEQEAKSRNSNPGKIRKELKNNQNIMGQILYKKVVDLLLDYAVTNEVEFDEHGHYHSEEQENELYDTYSPEENAGNNDQVKEEENKEE